jgi:hypothetical protein
MKPTVRAFKARSVTAWITLPPSCLCEDSRAVVPDPGKRGRTIVSLVSDIAAVRSLQPVASKEDVP